MTADSTAPKIVRESEPINLEFPFESLGSVVTPTDSFYVRNHFPEPEIESASWQLSIEGSVSTPIKLTYDELIKLPSKTMMCTLECAGNSRVFLVPKVKGAQWGLGAVGNAEWTGVPLQLLLERAGVKADALDVVFEGSDEGIPDDPPQPKSPINYARSVSVEEAKQSEILLAYKMNGQALSQSHGFPLRVIVPGWYGMASVKWLKRIVVTNFPFDGYFQKVDYAFWEDRNGLKVRVPITEIEVKAQIAQPSPHEVVSRSTSYTIHGAAWAGLNKIAKVEISTDDGQTWSNAKLNVSDSAYSWSLWSYEWKTPEKAQKCVLRARATDAKGTTQPLHRDPTHDSYRISHVIPIPVQVR